MICATVESNQLGERLEAYQALAVLEGLLPGMDNPQRKRIAFFKRKEMIHAKTVLIDDRWALGGSSNIARRSLYLDIEHAQR